MIARLASYLFPAVFVILIGVQGYQWFEDRNRDRASTEARTAFEKAVWNKAASITSDLGGARVISVNAYNETAACGWIHLNNEIGSVPFRASGSFNSKLDVSVLIPRLDATTPDDWAIAAFIKQLTFATCDLGVGTPRLPTAPSDAHRAPGVDEPIRALWGRNPPEWAVVPYPTGGFIAMRRHVGGGATISPVFLMQSDVLKWMGNEGAERARIEDTQGRERMRLFEECLARYSPDSPNRDGCFNESVARAATS